MKLKHPRQNSRASMSDLRVGKQINESSVLVLDQVKSAITSAVMP